MPTIAWFRRGHARRTLARSVTGFTATLPSSLPGISFTVRIKGKVFGIANCEHDPVLLATEIRISLREALADVTCQADPLDIAAAMDMCNKRLAAQFTIPSYPNVRITGTAILSLSRDDQKSLTEFISIRRKQGMDDLVKYQRASAIREYFTDPTFVLSWWMDQGGEFARKLPKPEELQAMADTFKKYPRITGHPIEYQVLDLLRAFIAEFPEQHQKQALLTLLSNGFQRAGADKLARQAESLASEAANPGNGTRPVP